MARTRSPNYPALSLPDAIDKTRRVYEKNHSARMDPLSVAKSLGMSSLHGSALTTISALRKYGLLEKDGKDLKVSREAVVILKEVEDSEERYDALQGALERPVLFDQLIDRYGSEEVDPETIAIHLETTMGFKSKAAIKASRNFRESVDFVTSQIPGYNAATDSFSSRDQDMPQTAERRAPLRTPPVVASGKPEEEIRYRLSPNCLVTLSFDGPVTQATVEKLRKFLEIGKDAYPKQEIEEGREN